ncbi:MAG: metalloregulator ArsR/SmtB family transcription factor [Balneolia bacterium]|nr:metalloregulator ArsR/SmtB family transcription factor [Balneolia bacterium]
MSTRDFKRNLYKELASVTKALSNPHRLEILDLLAQGAFSVEYISKQTNLPVANTSQHLQVLKNSGLVTTERDGKYIYYQLTDDQVLETWRSLRKLGFSRNEQISNMLEEFRKQKKQPELVSREELLEKLSRDEIYLIDVRPEEEFEAGHLSSAHSLPYHLMRKNPDQLDLPRDKEIIAYCRGPLCMMADEAVSLLREKGYRAFRLENGYTD